jgi:hypothetical protein
MQEEKSLQGVAEATVYVSIADRKTAHRSAEATVYVSMTGKSRV